MYECRGRQLLKLMVHSLKHLLNFNVANIVATTPKKKQEDGDHDNLEVNTGQRGEVDGHPFVY